MIELIDMNGMHLVSTKAEVKFDLIFNKPVIGCYGSVITGTFTVVPSINNINLRAKVQFPVQNPLVIMERNQT